MAIIVDKTQKRREIASSCRELFVNNSMKDLTISTIAKTANIGKGTIYDYFENKEEIVIELVSILMQEYNVSKDARIAQESSTKEKIKVFLDFFYSEEGVELREMYKDFIAISLTSPNQKITDFHTKCFNDYYQMAEALIKEGINNGEITPLAEKLTKGLFALTQGLFILSITTDNQMDLKKEINDYIDAIFSLIEVKMAHTQ